MPCPPSPPDHGLIALWVSVGMGLGALALYVLGGYRRPEKPPDR